MKPDPAVEEIRAVRREISAERGHDTGYRVGTAMKRHLGYIATLSAVLLITNSAGAQIWFVDYERGNDAASGRGPAAAFRHCPGDSSAVGTARSTRFRPGAKVVFKGGVHYRGTVSIPFSGEKGRPIVYDGNTAGTYGKGRAIIQGGEPVAGWKKVASAGEVEGNPNWSRLYCTYLEAGRTFFSFSLYEGEKYLNCAQDPNPKDPFYHDRLDTYRKTQTATQSSVTDAAYFTQNDPKFFDGAYASLHVRPNVMTYPRITGYDPAQHAITFKRHGKRTYGGSRGHRYAIINCVRFLDRPGEYYLDEKNAEGGRIRLVLWPCRPGEKGPEDVTISKRKYGIVIQNASHVVIDGFNIYQQGGNRSAGIYHPGNRGGVIQNLTIRNCEIARGRTYPGRSAAILMSWVSHSLIDHCYIYENAYCAGLMLTQWNDSVAQRTLLRKNGSTAVDYYNCHRSKLLYNIVRDNLGMHANGLTMYVGSTDILVEGNEVYNANGVTTNDGNNIVIRNNIFASHPHSAMGLWSSAPLTNLTIVNNLCLAPVYIGNSGTGWVFRNNVIGGIDGRIQPDAQLSHNIYTRLGEAQRSRRLGEGEKVIGNLRQLFVNPDGHDYRPRPGGPLVNVGTDVGIKEDFVGTAVPQGGRPDIGPYESVPNGPRYSEDRADDLDAWQTPPAASRTAERRRTPRAKARAAPRRPTAEAVLAWDAKLRARVREEVAAGRRVQFSVTAFQQRFEVLSADEAGTLELKGAVTEMNMEWPRLAPADKKSLALAVLREGSPEGHCLAAFFLIASGDEKGAEKHLARGGGGAAGVKASFVVAGGASATEGAKAGAEEAAKPAERREPKARPASKPTPAEEKSVRGEDDAALAKLYQEAETLFIDGEIEKATAIFSRIVEEDPDTPTAEKARGYLDLMK